MTPDYIASLQKAIATYEQREAGYKETIESLSNSLEIKTAGITRLLMRTDKLKRDMADAQRDIKHLQQAVLDMAATQKQNTESRKKFEAGYYGRIGE